MYGKILLAYDGSVEGRLALREGARLAKLCEADVFLLAVVNLSTGIIMAEGVAPDMRITPLRTCGQTNFEPSSRL